VKFKIRYAERLVGLFVLLAGLALAVSVILLGANQRWFSKNYRFTTRFNSALGAAPGTAIMMKGFQVGKIMRISLNATNDVDAEFVIYDTYYPKVRQYSILELVTSPIGLGTQLLFHPGKGETLLDEGSFVPLADSEEGRDIIDQDLVEIPVKDDTITRLLADVNPMIENFNKTLVTVNRTITELNRAIAGQTSGPLGQIVSGTAEAVDRANGLVRDANRLVEDVDGIMKDIGAEAEGFLADMRDQANELIEDVRKQADDLGLGLRRQVDDLVGNVDGFVSDARGYTEALVGDVRGYADSLVGDVRGYGDALVGDVRTHADSLVGDVRSHADGVVGQVDDLMDRIDVLIASVNRVVENLETTTAAMRDPTGLVPRLLDPKGSLRSFLDDKNVLYDRIATSVSDLEQTIKNIQDMTASLNSQMPSIAVAIDETKTAIKQAQDVLESLKNNPLLKGGVPERTDQGQGLNQGLREGNF
jgi:phospholipid/cholesterol/gamma-HCH transport system substrate-binding protein